MRFAITVQCAKDRFQFDKPLGIPVDRPLPSGAVTTVDGAETLVWEAGWARREAAT